jgi:hypothetical protein
MSSSELNQLIENKKIICNPLYDFTYFKTEIPSWIVKSHLSESTIHYANFDWNEIKPFSLLNLIK